MIVRWGLSGVNGVMSIKAEFINNSPPSVFQVYKSASDAPMDKLIIYCHFINSPSDNNILITSILHL